MRILLVTDQFDGARNGTTVSARRFARALAERGHQVRVVCAGPGSAVVGPMPVADDGAGPVAGPAGHGIEVRRVRPLRIPLFQRLIDDQSMVLARPDESVLREALAWADVAHVLLPFWLGRTTVRLARTLGVPVTAAFHLQPENVTYNLGLGRARWANELVYRALRPLYQQVGHVHCPSEFIAGQLREHGYTADLHVISNGVDPRFTYRKLPRSADLHGVDARDAVVVTMIGRLSPEKRQDVLIEAVRRSRHAERIQLVLAGSGPLEARLRQQAAGLRRPPLIRFFTQDELRDLLAMSDLYVHAADAEIEAISCIEAFASGLVPVIAASKRSATPQFALDERSLFAPGDPADLARRIDYWIEHPDERDEMEHVYARSARRYTLAESITRIEKMFDAAVDDAAAAGARVPAPSASGVR